MNIDTSTDESPVDVLIEGGGFPAFWYCLGYGRQYISNKKPKLIAGYSSGSIVALLLLFPNINLLDIIETYANYINCCNIFSLEYSIRNMLEIILPEYASPLVVSSSKTILSSVPFAGSLEPFWSATPPLIIFTKPAALFPPVPVFVNAKLSPTS